MSLVLFSINIHTLLRNNTIQIVSNINNTDLIYPNRHYLQKISPQSSHENMISNSSNNHIWKLKTNHLLKIALQLSQVFPDSEKICNLSIYRILKKYISLST